MIGKSVLFYHVIPRSTMNLFEPLNQNSLINLTSITGLTIPFSANLLLGIAKMWLELILRQQSFWLTLIMDNAALWSCVKSGSRTQDNDSRPEPTWWCLSTIQWLYSPLSSWLLYYYVHCLLRKPCCWLQPVSAVYASLSVNHLQSFGNNVPSRPIHILIQLTTKLFFSRDEALSWAYVPIISGTFK